MEKELLYKSRSISSCIQAAYRLMSDNFSNIIRSTWLPVLLLSLMSGIFVTLNIPSPDIFTLGIAHQTSFLATFAISLLGMLFCGIWVASRLMSMLNERPRRWNFTRMLILILNCLAIGICLYAILFISMWMASKYTGGNLMHFIKDNWLVVLGIYFVIILAFLPLYYICMRYLCDEKANFWRDLPKTYMTGLRHLGFIFLITLLVYIIVAILILVISLPLIILQVANTASLLGEITGDPSGLPNYFIPLVGITTFVVTILVTYVYMYPLIVYFFMYGSIEKQNEERSTTAITQLDLPETQLM